MSEPAPAPDATPRGPASDIVPCLSVTADEAAVDEVTWRLEELGATAIETRDARTLASGPRGGATLLAGFADTADRDRALEAVRRLDRVAEVTAIEVGDDGWSSAWRKFHEPVVLERIEVIAPWMERSGGARAAIVIDPGRAFGTGGHATTRMVLEMLERRAAERGLPGQVLDVGTGSGVLAIAALALGAERAVAIDSDPDAVSAARENAERNRLGAAIEICRAAPDAIEERFPLVLANLDLGAFTTAAARIADLVAADGEVLVSGLLTDEVAGCLELWPGFEPLERKERNGWAALALGRKR